jgi:hypothetical protein
MEPSDLKISLSSEASNGVNKASGNWIVNFLENTASYWTWTFFYNIYWCYFVLLANKYLWEWEEKMSVYIYSWK